MKEYKVILIIASNFWDASRNAQKMITNEDIVRFDKQEYLGIARDGTKYLFFYPNANPEKLLAYEINEYQFTPLFEQEYGKLFRMIKALLPRLRA